MTTEQSRTLGVAATGTFLVLVVFTTPLTAMPKVAASLGAGPSAQTWLLASVSLGLAASLLTTGAIGDDRGRRLVLVLGAATMAVAGLVCALSPDPVVFVLGGVAQGVGGAAVLSCSLGLIGHAFPAGPERARASGVWGASVGAGVAAGPLLAAGLEAVSSWRWAYALTALGAAAVGLAARLRIPESRAERPKPIDVRGALLLGGALACLVAGLVDGRAGFGQPLVVVLLVVAAVLVVAFVATERRSGAPMLDLGLFRLSPFVAVSVAAVGIGIGVIALLSYLPTVLQREQGRTPLTAALVMLVWSGTSVVAALGARRLPARFTGRAQLAVGLVVVAVGQAGVAGLTGRSSLLVLLPGLFVAGVGSGLLNAALGREAVASVPEGRGAMGSGANNTARYVGSAVGVTLVVALTSGFGWATAALATAALSLLAALVVGLARERRRVG